MGFLSRLKNANDVAKGRPVELRLSLPTRLRVPITPGKPSLLIHVIDPALVMGESWGRVVALRQAAVNRSVPSECEPSSIAEMLIESIANDPVFDSARPRIDSEFVNSWVSAGYSIAAREEADSTRLAPGALSSVVSAAMTACTLDLESPGLAMAAQCVLRDAYVAARMRRDGPTTAHIDLELFHPDFRLALLREPWETAHLQIEGWVSRMPLPSTNRTEWLNTLANNAVDGDGPFSAAVVAANKMLRDFADRMGGHEPLQKVGEESRS